MSTRCATDTHFIPLPPFYVLVLKKECFASERCFLHQVQYENYSLSQSGTGIGFHPSSPLLFSPVNILPLMLQYCLNLQGRNTTAFHPAATYKSARHHTPAGCNIYNITNKIILEWTSENTHKNLKLTFKIFSHTQCHYLCSNRLKFQTNES